MNIILLLALNIINTLLFWVMWRGFYFHEDQVFNYVALFQVFITLVSFSAYMLRNSDNYLVKRLSPKDLYFNNNYSGTYIGAISLAYGFGLINVIVISTLFIVLGGVDIWRIGSNT